MATQAMEMAGESMNNENQARTLAPMGMGRPVETPDYAKEPRRTPISVESVIASRVVHVTIAGDMYGYDGIMAAEDPDTKVISLRVACQTHPLARWRRIAPRLIRNQFGESEIPRLMQALDDVIAHVEAEFAK